MSGIAFPSVRATSWPGDPSRGLPVSKGPRKSSEDGEDVILWTCGESPEFQWEVRKWQFDMAG